MFGRVTSPEIPKVDLTRRGETSHIRINDEVTRCESNMQGEWQDTERISMQNEREMHANERNVKEAA